MVWWQIWHGEIFEPKFLFRIRVAFTYRIGQLTNRGLFTPRLGKHCNRVVRAFQCFVFFLIDVGFFRILRTFSLISDLEEVTGPAGTRRARQSGPRRRQDVAVARPRGLDFLVVGRPFERSYTDSHGSIFMLFSRGYITLIHHFLFTIRCGWWMGMVENS